MKLTKLFVTLSLAATMAGLSNAQNPVIRDQFSADPTARVFNGRMYLFPSHDIPSPVEKLKDWFCMADYHVFSSDNLTDWTDHGVIVSQERVPWVNAESYSMWAPDCVEKNGRYYFYFPANRKGEGQHGFGIGVAIADKPEGPYRPMWRPIEGVSGIDPVVLNDDDGASYIYWSGMGFRCAKLDESMTALAETPVQIKGLPETGGLKEGPFVFKRNGKYYMTYPWVRDPKGRKTEALVYAMSDSPYGPFEYKGLIMEESPTGCWTNHHSIVNYNGQWYLFYHHNDYSPTFDKNRSVRIDSLSFAPNGEIIPVVPTLRGVGLSSAREHIQLDRYSEISKKGLDIDFLNPARTFDGWKTIFKSSGAWVRYNAVDFGSEPVEAVTVRAKSASAATLVVSTAAGKEIARVAIPASKTWVNTTCKLTGVVPTGVADLKVTLLKGKNVEVDWLGFDALPWSQGAFATGNYRNIFEEMGYGKAEIAQKLDSIYRALFEGPDKVYFEVGPDMGYISDIKNHDVRTEGMSYGLMIAVQLDKKDVFDRLWRWGKKYMQHQDGPLEGYFAWSCKTDGTRNSAGPASDGELYYITSLIFAANRWGNEGEIRYLDEARRIVDCAMKKAGHNTTSPLINLEHKLITFTPDPNGGAFTDPSYHVPAFYEVWAQWLGDGRSNFWRDCAAKSREYLHAATHPVTGLNPDYSAYDGSVMNRGGVIGDAFRYDSWRVPMNIALDYSWSCADRKWQNAYANRIQNFLYSQGIDDFVDQYNIDGTPVERVLSAGGYTKVRHSVGFVATSAAASLAATHMKSREFVERLWNSKHEPYEDGYFDAYYDGLLRLFAFMHLSGNYRIITPQQS